MASSIGETPVSSEKFPSVRYAHNRIITPTTTPTISEEMIAISTPIASYFGGARSSSGVRLSAFSKEDIETKNKKSTYRDKYICKVQNSKIFYRDEVDHMSIYDPFMCMRQSSCENQNICNIEKFGFFRIFFTEKIIQQKSNDSDRNDL